jgi:CDP-4-dehydro-6-deoxyglucose reductase, E3
MIRQALARGGDEPLWLLLGARTDAELLYVEELTGLVAKSRRLRVVPSLSRPEPAWTGRRGYVQAHVAELWAELERAGGTTPAHAYVCGVRRMLDEVRQVLRDALGVERQRVHLERYD